MTLDLDGILAKARAAKDEAESGDWHAPDRDDVDARAWRCWGYDIVVNQSTPPPAGMSHEGPRVLVRANSNFPGRAVLDHIAATCPDAVIALIERLRETEAERDLLVGSQRARIAELERKSIGVLATPEGEGQ